MPFLPSTDLQFRRNRWSRTGWNRWMCNYFHRTQRCYNYSLTSMYRYNYHLVQVCIQTLQKWHLYMFSPPSKNLGQDLRQIRRSCMTVWTNKHPLQMRSPCKNSLADRNLRRIRLTHKYCSFSIYSCFHESSRYCTLSFLPHILHCFRTEGSRCWKFRCIGLCSDNQGRLLNSWMLEQKQFQASQARIAILASI